MWDAAEVALPLALGVDDFVGHRADGGVGADLVGLVAFQGVQNVLDFSRRARFGATSMETLKAFRRVTGWR